MKRIWVVEYLSGGGEFHGDALLAMGASMRDAMVADLLRCPVVTSPPRHARVRRCCRGAPPRCRRCPAEHVTDFVARQAAAHDAVWLVAPETDGLLARVAATPLPAERWLGCDAASIAAGEQQARHHRACLAAHGVLTPMAFAGAAAAAALGHQAR